MTILNETPKSDRREELATLYIHQRGCVFSYVRIKEHERSKVEESLREHMKECRVAKVV